MVTRHRSLALVLFVSLLVTGCGAVEPTTTSVPFTPTPAPPTATAIPPTAEPSPPLSPTPADLPVEVIRDAPYVANGDPLQKLDIYRPQGLAGPFPTLFALHGGGGNKSDMAGLAYYFAKRGFAVVSINRRQSPQYNYPVPVQDAFCALAWVHANAGTYGLDPARIVAVGHSAGGTLAAMLGVVDDPALFMKDCPHPLPTARRVRGVVTFTGTFDYLLRGSGHDPADMAQVVTYLGGAPDQVPDTWKQASAITWVDRQDPPFLLIHGLQDKTIDPEQSKSFAAALQKAGVDVELLLLPDADHGAIVRSEQSFQAVAAFCARLWP
jgi:acetyl esterase/lipase